MEIIITQIGRKKSFQISKSLRRFCKLLFPARFSSSPVFRFCFGFVDRFYDYTIKRRDCHKQPSKQHIHVEVLICLLQFHCCGSQDKGTMKVWGPCLLLLLPLPLLLSFLSLCRASAGDERLPYKLASRPLPSHLLCSIWKTMIFLLLYCLVERA
jgi:hypothetical protein